MAASIKDLCRSSLREVVAMRRLLEALGPGGIATKVRKQAVSGAAAKKRRRSEEVVMERRLLASLAPMKACGSAVVLMVSQ